MSTSSQSMQNLDTTWRPGHDELLTRLFANPCLLSLNVLNVGTVPASAFSGRSYENLICRRATTYQAPEPQPQMVYADPQLAIYDGLIETILVGGGRAESPPTWHTAPVFRVPSRTTIYFSDDNRLGLWGLGKPWEPPAGSRIERQGATPASELRRLTGLSVDRLSSIFSVSRVAYHNWMAGRHLSLENDQRLRRVLAIVDSVRKARRIAGSELGRWLARPLGTSTTTPLDLLRDGRETAVLALALQPTRTDPLRSPLTDEAVALSGSRRTDLSRISSRFVVEAESARERAESLRGNALVEDDTPPWEDDTDDGALARGIYSG